MRDAIVSDGMICHVSTVGRPGIVMSHTCVDHIVLPSGKFIVRADKAIRLLSTSAPSIMKIDVAPVSVMAWFVAIVSTFEYCGMGLPNKACAIATIEVCAGKYFIQLEVMIVAVSSSTNDDVLRVEGSKEHEVADNKFLHLCANDKISAPHHQNFCAVGRTGWCIPLVQGSYPTTVKCCAFPRVNPVW
jgi:hypothetical protein